jgi:hypothetical protein
VIQGQMLGQAGRADRSQRGDDTHRPHDCRGQRPAASPPSLFQAFPQAFPGLSQPRSISYPLARADEA